MVENELTLVGILVPLYRVVVLLPEAAVLSSSTIEGKLAAAFWLTCFDISRPMSDIFLYVTRIGKIRQMDIRNGKGREEARRDGPSPLHEKHTNN